MMVNFVTFFSNKALKSVRIFNINTCLTSIKDIRGGGDGDFLKINLLE